MKNLCLSFAVDAAFQNIGQRSNVHLIQADLFHLPFRQGLFDIVYSMGVLHHTPNTQQAFEAIVPYAKTGGRVAIWVYSQSLSRLGSRFWRKLTTKLPKRVIYYLAIMAVPMYFVYKLPWAGRALYTIMPISLYPNWKWRWLDTFDWYSPQYQWLHTDSEVRHWFEASGFEQIEILSWPVSVRGVRPLQETISASKL